MVAYVETDRRVFRLECGPDAPGYRRRWIKVWVESGPAVPDHEWDRVLAALVAEAASMGLDNIRWSA